MPQYRVYFQDLSEKYVDIDAADEEQAREVGYEAVRRGEGKSVSGEPDWSFAGATEMVAVAPDEDEA